MVEQLDEGVWTTEVALDEYNVRGALVAGSHRAIVWDTLSHPRDMQGYLPLIGDRELVIVYSHADWDHIWGTAGLPFEPASIVGHRACLERFSSDVPATLEEKQAGEPGRWDEVRLVPPRTVFDVEHRIDLGGMTLELRHLPGHTEDCIVGFVPERGLLVAGDTVETPLPVVPPGAPLDRWIEGLERWARDGRVSCVVPAHGSIGGPEIVHRTIAYLYGLRDGRPAQVGEALTAFYRQTHEANLRAWRPPSAGSKGYDRLL
ncbi:MAG: MBL fold metallo-hydrolase [Acidobacteria bacterium]|nr:MAG: MBL fold metallo-hydrolase [Acidobacteriota bacterium]